MLTYECGGGGGTWTQDSAIPPVQIQLRGLLSRWQKSKMRPPSSRQTHQNYICIWITPSKHILNPGRETQTSQLIFTEWGRVKDKRKKETKEFGRRTRALGREHKEGKVSTHMETPSQVQTRRTSERQRGVQQQVLKRQNRIQHRDQCWPALPSLKHMSTWPLVRGGWVLRVKFQGSGSRKRTGADCCEDTLKRVV